MSLIRLRLAKSFLSIRLNYSAEMSELLNLMRKWITSSDLKFVAHIFPISICYFEENVITSLFIHTKKILNCLAK